MSDFCVLLVKDGEPSIEKASKFIDWFFVKILIKPAGSTLDFVPKRYLKQFTWHQQIIIADGGVAENSANTSAYTRLGDAIYGDFVVCLGGNNLSTDYWKYDLKSLTSKDMASIACKQLTFKNGKTYDIG